jgi:hypothetical protein
MYVMATETSSIDELLVSEITSTRPAAPETQYEPEDETYDEPVSGNASNDVSEDSQDEGEEEPSEQDASEESPSKEREVDDYGNAKKAPRTYSEEEVNEMFRKRFKNQAPEVQQQMQQQQAQGTGFEYNPESTESWQTQLEQFVEATISKVSQKQVQAQHQQREAQAQMEFEDKFTRGMERFSDFRDVVGAAQIDDPMTYALRGMNDPAAFIYAAAKRQPQELSRISNIQDPYAKMVEMGKLEERMRKTAASTSAPRPITRAREDGSMPINNAKKEASIEDLIAKSDAKRRAQLVAKRGR